MPQDGVRSHLQVRVDALGRSKTGALMQEHPLLPNYGKAEAVSDLPTT